MEPVEPVLKNIYQSNAYSWAQLGSRESASEGPTILHELFRQAGGGLIEIET